MKHITTKTERGYLFQKCVCGLFQRVPLDHKAKAAADNFEKKHRKCGRVR